MLSVNCPLCGSSAFGAMRVVSERNGETIVRCSCGMVYKRGVDIGKKWRCYKSPKVWDTDAFARRYGRVARYLQTRVSAPEKILDIGCATGAFSAQLHRLWPDAKIDGVEGSPKVAEYCAKNNGFINLHRSTFEAWESTEGYDLVVCMGVDYLFPDHAEGMNKIEKALKEGGTLYFERNVFMGMKGFMGKPIDSDEVLFWENPLITTWFTEEQAECMISDKYLIIDRSAYEEGGSRHVGWLCKKIS